MNILEEVGKRVLNPLLRIAPAIERGIVKTRMKPQIIPARTFSPSELKKPFALWPKYLGKNPTWQMTNLDKFITEGYNLNAVIYAAIMYKVRAAQAAPMRAWLGTQEMREPLPADHPLARLLERPNPYQSFIEYDAEQRVYFNLFGNSYTVFFRERATGYPQSFIGLRPDRVHHLYSKTGKPEIVGYLYVPYGATFHDGIGIAAQDVMHVKLPNPGDPYSGLGKGMPPLFPGAQSADVDNSLTAYLKQFVDYGAMPAHVLSYDYELTDDQIANARERWMEIYGGSYNWTDVAVLDKNATLEKVGSTLDELASAEIDARNEGRITMVFGVPLPLIETNPQVVQSTYSNLEQYERFFWNNTMIPELRWFQTDLIFYLRGEDGSFPAYDFDVVPALQEIRDARAKMMIDAGARGFATRADVRQALGLAFDPVLDNVYLIPLTIQPIPASPKPQADDEGGAEATQDEEQREEEPAEGTTEPSEETQEEAGVKPYTNTKANPLTLEQKQILWKQFIRTAEAFQPPANRAGTEAFRIDEREILAIVNGAKSDAYRLKQSINWPLVFSAVGVYLATDSKDTWRRLFDPVFNGVIGAQVTRLNDTFGQELAPLTVTEMDVIRQYKFQFVDPISQTSIEELRGMFDAAAAEGWSVPRMNENLGIIFEQWVEGGVADTLTEEQRQASYFATNRLPPHRREIISRTEMIRASNASSVGTYKGWGVQMKEWLSTPDPRTRDAHRVGISWGQDPLIVGIDESFDIGGSQLQYPGDPNAPLALTAQCRCTTLPVMQ